MKERCDQIMNCKDESDEDNCNLIVFKNNYNKKVPPFTVMADFSVIPAKILVSTKLENVLAISEFSHTIDLKIQIKLRWYENRVLYHNLKFQEALNVLTDSEVINIYIFIIKKIHMHRQLFFRSAKFGCHTLSSKTLMMMKQ